MVRQRKWKASVTKTYDKTSPSLGIQSIPKRVERCSHYRTVVDQPTWGIRQLSSLHELGAQLVYLTESTKKEEEPNLKHVLSTLLHGIAVTAVCLLSNVGKKERFATAFSNSCTRQRQRNEAQERRQIVQHSDFDGVRPEIRLIVSLYLDELPG